MYVVPGIVVLLIIVLSLMVLIPRTQGIFEKRQLLSQAREQLAGLEKKHSLLQSIQSDTSLKYLADSESALPSEKDAASILVSLQNLSTISQFGVDAISFRPGLISTESATAKTPATPATAVTATSVKGAQIIPVAVTTFGTSDQFLAFVEALLGSRRLFDVQNVQVGMRGAENVINASFSLLAYYLPLSGKIGALDSILPELTADEKVILSQLVAMPDVGQELVGAQIATPSGQLGKTNLFGL